MDDPDVRRRRLLKGGGAVLAGLSLQVAAPARAFARESDQGRHDAWDDDQPDPSQTLGRPGDVVLPWLDQPPPDPVPEHRRKPAGLGRARLLADPCRELPLRHSLRRTRQWPGRGQLARRRLAARLPTPCH